MRIRVTVAIEHRGYESEYGKDLHVKDGEPSGINEKAFHNLCDVVLYSAGGEFKQHPGEPLRHRMNFVDYRDPTDEFDVVVEVDAPDKALPHHIVECLIMMAQEISGEVFEKVDRKVA